MSVELPQKFIEDTAKKVEKYGLSLPITPPELEKMCADDSNSEKALSSMIQYALRYALDVWSMKEFAAKKSELDEDDWAEKLAKIDSDRTRLHDTYIDSVAILARSLNNAEKDTEWVRTLMPSGKLDRAACGKFAIMLSYWLSVNSRQDI